jgi:NADPH-dependent ferric siderophore reductase
MTPDRHQMTRVRHDTRRRTLTVDSVETLTPMMRRIHFVSPELHDFVSAAPDDHVKLFLPMAGADVCMRDFTPRRFDAVRGTLTIDFALHQSGPATAWARAAQRGDTIEIGGPRGSSIVTDDFDWYLLIGDETALPAIGRRVEELRPDVPVITLVTVNDAAEQQEFVTRAAWTPQWLYRGGQAFDDVGLIEAALSTLALPPGEGYIWIAAQTSVARAVRRYVTERLGHPKAWLKSSGYWTEGIGAAHETIED